VEGPRIGSDPVRSLPVNDDFLHRHSHPHRRDALPGLAPSTEHRPPACTCHSPEGIHWPPARLTG
jgi:hypothetical protein